MAGGANVGGCGTGGGAGACHGGLGAGGVHAGGAAGPNCSRCGTTGAPEGLPRVTAAPDASFPDRKSESFLTVVYSLSSCDPVNSDSGEPDRSKTIVAPVDGVGSGLGAPTRRSKACVGVDGGFGVGGRICPPLSDVPGNLLGLVDGVEEFGVCHERGESNSSVKERGSFFGPGGIAAERGSNTSIKLLGEVSGLGGLDCSASRTNGGRECSSVPDGVSTPSPNPNRRVNEPGERGGTPSAVASCFTSESSV
jgi:hypothetical protein